MSLLIAFGVYNKNDRIIYEGYKMNATVTFGLELLVSLSISLLHIICLSKEMNAYYRDSKFGLISSAFAVNIFLAG